MSFIPLEQIKSTLQSTGKYWIVFTGDSITSCEWVHPNWRDIVVYVLQKEIEKLMGGDWKTPKWGIKGFNFAYDGSTTKDILEKIDEILSVQPQLIIGLMGGNDPVFGISVRDSIGNIEEICKAIIKVGSKVVWCSSTSAGKGAKKNLEYEPYSKAFLEAELENVNKIDMFNIYKNFPTEKFFTFISEENPVEGIKAGEKDLQHPNQLGNAYITKVILDRVFGIIFNPEKYVNDTLKGKKYPEF